MKKLIVLAKHKFNTIDTITPILLEISVRTSTKMLIFFPKENDLIQLKKNLVLYDALTKIGSLKLFGNENFFLRKIIKIFYLINFIFLALRRHKFIHFGDLDNWPFKIISMINKKNVYYCQPSTYYNEYEKYAGLIYNVGNFKDPIQGKGWKNVKKVSCDNIIVNDERNYYQKHPEHKKKNFFIYGPSRLSNAWINYSKKYEVKILNSHKNFSAKSGYIVFVLGTFVPYRDFKSKNSQIELFKETIDVLKDLKIPTLIKPHYYTQMEIINEELNKIKNENIYITYTHPTVLALNAKIWICNLFSTTCGDAFGLGVPTVEYSDYNDKLKKLTNNSSQNSEQIDYFISKDKKKLQDTLVQILSEQKKISQRLFFKDKNNLIQHLMRD